MKIHFIAIGGSAMHNLAIALKKKGYQVSGSDDEIFEPSRTRLKKYGILPEKEGWYPEQITSDIDAIILGMHARKDNPEMLRAAEMGIKIYSYPDYLYEQSKKKKRVVIGGSHGKTTITSMIIHVLQLQKMNIDYMVGAQLEGFEVMVKLSDEAPVIILEGDEYLTSPLDLRPKFHVYRPDIALISGIAWDHINVFPTFDNYVDQFKIFADQITEGGTLIYCNDNPEVKKIGEHSKTGIKSVSYNLPKFEIINGKTQILFKDNKYPLLIFGKHNLLNLEGARLVCNELGIGDEVFYQSISTFKGASKRLELVRRNEQTNIYKDFAHSPSKLEATTKAVKSQFPDRKLVACIELHTFSSLNQQFLSQYKGSLDSADIAIVYYNSHTLALKRLPDLKPEDVKAAFGNENIQIFTDSNKLKKNILEMNFDNGNLLMMSSGNFDGIDFSQLADKIIEKAKNNNS